MRILKPGDLLKIIADHRTDTRVFFLRLLSQQYRDMIVDLYRYEYILPVDGEAYLVEDDTQIVHDACLHIARIDKDVSGDDLKTNDPFLHAAVSYVDRISIDHFDI